MIWPWTEIAKLKRTIEHLENRDNHRLFIIGLRENIALKAMRELAAANTGIRRLKARLKPYEQKERG